MNMTKRSRFSQGADEGQLSSKIITKPKEVYFSIFNNDVEGYYSEVENIELISDVIERALFKYNDSTDR